MSNEEEPAIRLKELRLKRKLNQSELARMSNITPSAISQIEAGERTPSLAILRRLAKSLDVSIDYLAGKSNTENERHVFKQWLEFYQDFLCLSEIDRELLIKQTRLKLHLQTD